MISLVKERLKAYSPRSIVCAETISAGVMIPLFETEGEIFVVLTRRACSVKIHKGEVSFPGGMYEPEDGDLRTTALRECNEEIGVREEDVEIIGRLDDMYTLTGFVIAPYVGTIPFPYDFKLNSSEVAYLIHLPLNFLLETEPVIETARHDGKVQHVPSLYFEGDRIWGATCRILLTLRDIIGREKI